MQALVVVGPKLLSTDSIVMALGFSCSRECGVIPDPGSNVCPLHWQADS